MTLQVNSTYCFYHYKYDVQIEKMMKMILLIYHMLVR